MIAYTTFKWASLMRSKKSLRKLVITVALTVIGSGILIHSIPTLRLYVSTNLVAYVADVFISYRYYGENLSSLELYEMYEDGKELYCLQIPTEISQYFKFANRFECFDNPEDAAAYIAAHPELFDQNRR